MEGHKKHRFNLKIFDSTVTVTSFRCIRAPLSFGSISVETSPHTPNFFTQFLEWYPLAQNVCLKPRGCSGRIWVFPFLPSVTFDSQEVMSYMWKAKSASDRHTHVTWRWNLGCRFYPVCSLRLECSLLHLGAPRPASVQLLHLYVLLRPATWKKWQTELKMTVIFRERKMANIRQKKVWSKFFTLKGWRNH